MKFATKVIHAGMEPDPSTGAIIPPIYQTSTFVQEGPGVHKGYTYARSHNPTRTALQTALASLENGRHALCFGSGMAAIDAALRSLKPGDEVVATADIYGGTYRLMNQIYAPMGVIFRFVDLTDAEALHTHIGPGTKMIWMETPTNPLLKIIDLEAVVKHCQNRGIITVVDNTFASPYLQTPLDIGVDLVMHSATKYLGGHSDVIMGALITNDDELAQRLAFVQNTTGAVPGPQDCFLVLRGLKTLALRMERHGQNAMKVAHWLDLHPKVGAVYYPGLPQHPGHALASRQMRDFGGMVSFELKDQRYEEALRVMKGLELFALGESLGGVESLCAHPASMSHGSVPKAEREAMGISDGLIRLSVGIEDIADLLGDLERAIA
ncbi:cystathionine gamma-synthase [Dyadobacter tibetensis]|uniref:cystathionine gamma-synthase n=1 Tax=Dyadobacter tibetensis TaxID=1211851 RepID=UPI00047107A5|nr:cystathionine gamma-synthase [Dyadobacter tibetensis]